MNITSRVRALPVRWYSGSRVSGRSRPHCQKLSLSRTEDSFHLREAEVEEKRRSKGKEKEKETDKGKRKGTERREKRKKSKREERKREKT